MNREFRKGAKRFIFRFSGVLVAGLCLASFGYGRGEVELKGSAQVLAMGRDLGDGAEGTSVSASLVLEARTQLSEMVSVKGQFLHVQRLGESGCENAGYWLSNDTTSALNELYVDWKLERVGLGKTSVRLGRQVANYDFFASYKSRHKEQAFEGVVFQMATLGGGSLDVGHIERYSTWSCREDGLSSVTSEFETLGERLGFGGDDSGVQFVSGKWARGESWETRVYDYYAGDFYNTAGVKLGYTFPRAEGEADWTVSGHYIRQDGLSGGFMAGHDAESLEMNLRFKHGGLAVDTGWTHIGGGSNLAVPFRTSYVIDATLLWYTNQFEAGTDSLHWKSAYSKGKWTVAGGLVAATHADEREEQELDVMVRYAFETRVWVAFKGGYGRRDFAGDKPGQEARDLRLFAGYSF